MKALGLVLMAAAGWAQTAPGVRLPEYSRTVLPNGVVLDVMPRRGVPLVTVRVLVKGGVESDPAGMGGLASTTAELLRRGTKTRTADQFSDELDALGATFIAGATPQATLISTEFMAKDTARALDLFGDALLRPAFPEIEVTKAIDQGIDASRSIKDEPMSATPIYFRSFFFGSEHPYGHPASGDEISLKRITRAAIADYHARIYAGRNMIVIAAGDFEAAPMRAQLEKMFGAVPAGNAYEWRKAAAPKASAPRLLLIDKPDATQTYFSIGNPGITRTDPDRVPVWIVNTLFGGRFTSMLNDELRVNSGLTYGAGSRVDENRLTGAITLFTYTRTDATEKAIDLTLDIIKRLREKGITEEQLASGKAYLKGTFPAQALETPDQLSAQIGDLELFGLGRGEIDDLFARIDAVTLEQANAAARKYFGGDAMTFTLVGNAAKIRETAKKYAKDVVEIPITKPGF